MRFIIKKGKTAVFHFPVFLKYSSVYSTSLTVSESMFYTDDSCRPGWSKLWGISLGHIHWNNSYRFVYRIYEGEMLIGYYAYIGGVSPQVNYDFKRALLKDVKVGDKLTFEIKFEESGVIMRVNGDREVVLPLPVGFTFPITKCFPNIKCPINRDIIFDFE